MIKIFISFIFKKYLCKNLIYISFDTMAEWLRR